MKNKKWKSRIFFLLGLLLVAIIAFNSTTPIKANEGSATRSSISDTGYETWAATDLLTAQSETKDFLTSQKRADTVRPYKDNAKWTEGSLMAVDKAYQSSLKSEAGASSDLARMLLIETVRKLEVKTVTDQYDPTIKALNNYPDDNGNYDLEYDLPTVLSLPPDKTKKYDIMFVLDWSGSLWDGGTIAGLGDRPLIHQAKLVHRLSQHVIEHYSGSRIWLLGYGAASRNSTPLLYPAANTGFFNDSTDPAPAWQNKIDAAFPLSSSKPNYSEDNITGNLTDAVNKMKQPYVADNPKSGRDPKATPVIVYMSDFQLVSNMNVSDPPKAYTDTLTSYNRMAAADESDPTTRPIYLAVRYDHTGNTMIWSGATYNTLQNNVTKLAVPARNNWNWMPINASNARTASDDFLKMFGDSLPSFPSRAYKAQIIQEKFNYNTGSIVSVNGAAFQATTNKNLSIKHAIEPDNGSYSVKFDDSVVEPMGSNGKLLGASTLNFNAGEYKDYNRPFNGNPTLFYPYSEAAIEIHSYKGTGDKADKANYELKNTIVGENFNEYGGATTYTLKHNKLSSIKYGQTISKAEVLDITKAAIGDMEYNKLDFSDPNNLTAASQKVTFDAAKNVYKVYVEPNETQLVIEYWNETTNTQIQKEKLIPGVVGDAYEIDPVNDEQISGYDYVRSEGAPLKGSYTKTNQTIKLFYRESETLLTVYFKDEEGTPIKESVLLSKKPGDIVDLTSEVKVSTVVKSILDDLYELLPLANDEKSVEVEAGGSEFTYVFKGKVSIDATKEMKFKSGVITSRDQILDYDSAGSFMINVADKRGKTVPSQGYKRGQFKVAGSLTKPFTHEVTGVALNNAQLIYNDGIADKELSAPTGAEIYSSDQARPDTSYDLELANQSDKKDGLKLIVPKGSGATQGKYQAEITWELIQGP
ncbi:hypothetical protein ATZ33_08325 [Enterococcus silesiacus]|nr:MucBP domain-containing protein [Enterococcus silesiacus]ALS01371.1 hypothetical protein ATZ33_08325 [Enterococcus silesiacus]